MKRSVPALVLAALLVTPRFAAEAEPSGSGGFCDIEPGLCAGLQLPDNAPGDPQPHRYGELPRFYWARFEYSGSQYCTGPDGRQEYMRLIDRVTNQVITARFRCPDPTTGKMPPLPVPPVRVHSARWGASPPTPPRGFDLETYLGPTTYKTLATPLATLHRNRGQFLSRPYPQTNPSPSPQQDCTKLSQLMVMLLFAKRRCKIRLANLNENCGMFSAGRIVPQ